MSVTVRLPGALGAATGGETKLSASGATLADIIADIERRHPGFASRVLDERGAIRAYVLASLRSDEPELFAYRIRDGAVLEIPIVEP